MVPKRLIFNQVPIGCERWLKKIFFKKYLKISILLPYTLQSFALSSLFWKFPSGFEKCCPMSVYSFTNVYCNVQRGRTMHRENQQTVQKRLAKFLTKREDANSFLVGFVQNEFSTCSKHINGKNGIGNFSNPIGKVISDRSFLSAKKLQFKFLHWDIFSQNAVLVI